jgi:hypothetical protein
MLVLGQAYFIRVGHGLNPGSVFVSLGALKFGLNFALEKMQKWNFLLGVLNFHCFKNFHIVKIAEYI